MDIFGRKRNSELEAQNADLARELHAANTRAQQLEAENQRIHNLFKQVGGDQAEHVLKAVESLRHQHAHLEATLERHKQHVEAEKAKADEWLRAYVEELNQKGLVYQKSKEKVYEAIEKKLKRANKELADTKAYNEQLGSHTAYLKALYQDTEIYLDAGLSAYEHPAMSSIQYQSYLKQVEEQIKYMVKNNQATIAVPSFLFNNSPREGKKFINDMSKMCLQSYNNVLKNCILTVKSGNGITAKNRLDRTRDNIARLGRMIDLQINPNYHQLCHQQLDLTLAYQNAKKAERDAAREEEARLREERKAQKELEAERQRLLKEQAHRQTVLARLREQGFYEEAAKVEQELLEISDAIENVDYRAANIRAGYVYVISNVGAFGNRMVKIGLTRRLDPMDRVRELGDASVPFNFDVHALFFSDDAVGVENALHQHFADKRINMINKRREFFAVTPAEVKAVLTQIDGHILEFVEEPEAVQYRLSLQARGLPYPYSNNDVAPPEPTGAAKNIE